MGDSFAASVSVTGVGNTPHLVPSRLRSHAIPIRFDTITRAQARAVRIVDDQNRDLYAIQGGGHHGTHGDIHVGLAKRDSHRSDTPANGLGDTRRRSRRATAFRQNQKPSRDTTTPLRMMLIDDDSRLRVETAPETQGFIEQHDFTGGLARVEHSRGDFAAAHARAPQVSLRHKRSSRHTSPRSADSTHSSRVPNTDSTASIPGA